MQVPFINLISQHKSIEKEIKHAVHRVVKSCQFILKDCVFSLEEEVTKKVGAKFAIGVSSGTDALYLSLLSLGIGHGDEVITPPFTFFASAGSISHTGAKPVFADIDPVTFTLDPKEAESKITPRTKAIIPVHLYGLSCDMDPLLRIARRHGLAIVEDAAQAFGAQYRRKKVGSMGDMGCFSFYPTKNLGAAGDAGMIVTSSQKAARKLRLLRENGAKIKYHHEIIGDNSRLDEIQAAILLVKLKRIDEWNARRRRHAADYNEGLKGLPITTPYAPKDRKHVYHLYTILTPKRDALREYLKARDIGTGIYYPLPLHLQRCYKDLGYRKGDFPQTEKVTNHILSLPIYPELPEKAKDFVISNVRKFFLSLQL